MQITASWESETAPPQERGRKQYNKTVNDLQLKVKTFEVDIWHTNAREEKSTKC